MRSYIFIFFISLFIFTSCKNETTSVLIDGVLIDTIVVNSTKNINGIGESLKPNVKRAVRNWEEYQLVDAMITRFYAISNAEALSNAKELSTLSKQLKDSIRDKKLEVSSVKARLNVFSNECMRLEDMVDIPAIKQEEIAFEIKRILEAFSGVNAKLNSIYSVEDLEKELELDPDFQAMINNTNEDSISTDIVVQDNKPKKERLTPSNKRIKKENSTSLKSKMRLLLTKEEELKRRKKTQVKQKEFQRVLDKDELLKKKMELNKKKEIKK